MIANFAKFRIFRFQISRISRIFVFSIARKDTSPASIPFPCEEGEGGGRGEGGTLFGEKGEFRFIFSVKIGGIFGDGGEREGEGEGEKAEEEGEGEGEGSEKEEEEVEVVVDVVVVEEEVEL